MRHCDSATREYNPRAATSSPVDFGATDYTHTQPADSRNRADEDSGGLIYVFLVLVVGEGSIWVRRGRLQAVVQMGRSSEQSLAGCDFDADRNRWGGEGPSQAQPLSACVLALLPLFVSVRLYNGENNKIALDRYPPRACKLDAIALQEKKKKRKKKDGPQK